MPGPNPVQAKENHRPPGVPQALSGAVCSLVRPRNLKGVRARARLCLARDAAAFRLAMWCGWRKASRMSRGKNPVPRSDLGIRIVGPADPELAGQFVMARLYAHHDRDWCQRARAHASTPKGESADFRHLKESR